jgi:RNA polymerase sigma factor (sigma-70 family)
VTFEIHRIWESILEGDSTGWRQLVAAYTPLVLTVARRAGLGTSDAEDCVQQTWLSLYRRRKSIKNPTALPAWLIRTSHRKALTMQRRHIRQTDQPGRQEEVDPAVLPDQVIISLQEAAALRLAVEQLDPRCRRVMTELFLADGNKSYADIARDLKILPNSLGPLRSRCLDKLRKNLEKLGYTPD